MAELFDSSVLKVQADGDVVLSSYLDDGETLAPSSFAALGKKYEFQLAQAWLYQQFQYAFIAPSADVVPLLKKLPNTESPALEIPGVQFSYGELQVTSSARVRFFSSAVVDGVDSVAFTIYSEEDESYTLGTTPDKSTMSAEFAFAGNTYHLVSDENTAV